MKSHPTGSKAGFLACAQINSRHIFSIRESRISNGDYLCRNNLHFDPQMSASHSGSSKARTRPFSNYMKCLALVPATRLMVYDDCATLAWSVKKNVLPSNPPCSSSSYTAY